MLRVHASRPDAGRTLSALAAVVALGSAPAPASASRAAAGSNPNVSMRASFTPERLGAPSNINLHFRISDSDAKVPPPLRALDVRYPENIGLALSGLGVESCTEETLKRNGPEGCPVDSVMGGGSALAEVPFGPEVIHEPATLTIVRGPDAGGFITLLFDAQGISPVAANIVMTAQLMPAAAPYGGRISIQVPLVPSLPEAPPVVVSELNARIGPQGLLYEEASGGHTRLYSPKGIALPLTCPRRGFPFAGSFSFEAGAHRVAKSRVPCPGRRARRRRRAAERTRHG